MHGGAARSAASAGEGMGSRSQLPGGNGSGQQNGAYNGRKQRALTSTWLRRSGHGRTDGWVQCIGAESLAGSDHREIAVQIAVVTASRAENCRQHHGCHTVFFILFPSDYLGSGT
jgi:hypothetical protein